MRWQCLLFLVFVCLPLQAATHVIVAGAGGNETYRKTFNGWAQRLERVLIEKLGADPDKIFLLQQDPLEKSERRGSVSLAAIEATLQLALTGHDADEPFILYMMGHGSYLRGSTRFHLPGPDLTMTHLAELLTDVQASPLVVINTTAAAAGAINVLSGPDRVIVSATKSVQEQNATEFMEYFLQGLEQSLSDRNRDGRISIWEAARQATNLTQSHYIAQDLIATEHAILDDNGDGLGTRLTANPATKTQADETLDGSLATAVFLKDFQFPPAVPQAWIDRYFALIDQVEALKARKTQMDQQTYKQQLENTLLEVARAHRRIRVKMAETQPP